jgi:hypothetical protein
MLVEENVLHQEVPMNEEEILFFDHMNYNNLAPHKEAFLLTLS